MMELAQFAHVPHELEHTGLVFVGDERPARACVCVCARARACVCACVRRRLQEMSATAGRTMVT